MKREKQSRKWTVGYLSDKKVPMKYGVLFMPTEAVATLVFVSE